ncbi:predicted protein [Scheffersomyces stipitis CBS 6054]|uniref:Autophagy-related protein 2 n=1 Tax=Scheffersomyces stipitis (strain ATCC 58785 / CBS 6054 / NBRC 10063 / NRRL Y-11545) TaxID=322104 RepID=ATG2_PICST|nr:predicted protein [Scheffersomyces stipitis CBS 6054]A3LT28.2 RecName: Full=Autophagy-related protein 2 [Scheffersomyces stipitis CBS 6054]ABN66339.2 predicted protein [Scheffersomyces stipitis CBS 6054]
MSPQWMPQNIQKRLLLYVLQQLSLFSEIDLPNLEEVSLNNIVLRDISIDPEKVGKLPGCNLRFGQVGTLELNTVTGGTIIGGGGGVNVDARDVEVVISPDFDINEEVRKEVQFSLAQSTADLAKTIIKDSDSAAEDESDDTDEEIVVEPKKSRSSSSSSFSGSTSKPSALSAVMSRAVEMALSRLQIKITNMKIKLVSEMTDLLFEVDEVLINTVNGTRVVKITGVRSMTLKPNVNPGELVEKVVQSPQKDDTSDNEEDDSNYEDDNNDYGDESLMDSMVFTHEEASSIYLSATSQSFPRPTSYNVDEGEVHVGNESVSSDPPAIFHMDYCDVEFDGLSNVSNLKIDIGTIKVATTPLAPTIISILNGITRSLKIKNHQKWTQQALKRQQNSRFPQYAETTDELTDDEASSKDGENTDPFFNKLHIRDIIISTTSALSRDGVFASPDNSINFVLHNSNIKQKNDMLIYGGVETFRIEQVKEGVTTDIFTFESPTAATHAEQSQSQPDSEGVSFAHGSPPPPIRPMSPSSISSMSSSGSKSSTLKADLRFEIFKKLEENVVTIETTALLSKTALLTLDLNSSLILSNFITAMNSIHSNFKVLMATIENLSKQQSPKKQKTHTNAAEAMTTKTQFILQTSPIIMSVKFTQDLLVKAIIFPISYNLQQNQLSISKILINTTIRNERESTTITISNIVLLTKLHEFKSFIKRIANPSNANPIPREVQVTASSNLFISKIMVNIALKELKFVISNIVSFYDSFASLSAKQSNSLENSVLDFVRDRSHKLEISSILQPPGQSRRRIGPGFASPHLSNPTFVNISRNNIASFRCSIKEVELNLVQVLPKFGGLTLRLKDILLYEQKNDINGSILSFDIVRVDDGQLQKFVYEFQELPLESIRLPLIMIHCKNTEKISTVDVVIRNVLVEYYTQWLLLLDDFEANEEKLAELVVEKVKPVNPSSSQNRFDIRFSVFDCIIGLNPGRLPCKSYLVVGRGTSDFTFGVNQFYIKSSFRDVSALLIDDVKNKEKMPLKDNSTSRSRKSLPTSSYTSPLTFFSNLGYIMIGGLNVVHIGITFNTNIEEVMKRNEKLGISDNLSLIDLKINSDEHHLELCADSTHVLLQLINDLKLPLNFKDDEKMKVTVDSSINLMDDLDENQFQLKKRNISVAPGVETSSSSAGSENENLETIAFDEDHFSKARNKIPKGSKVDPFKLNINLSKTKIYLYDGYDWKDTRKAVRGAVKRVEAQAMKERLKKLKKQTDKDDYDEEDEFIEETLFSSIHVGIPRDATDANLTDRINKRVQSSLQETDMTPEEAQKAQINVELGKNYKNLKLRRSRVHKIMADFTNIEVNVSVYSTRDPRKDPTDENLPYELLNDVEVRLGTADVYDNVATSTWNKLLTYMNTSGEGEIGKSMLKLAITNVRPSPKLVSSEAIMKVQVLPVRLHIDQDTLDFLMRFLEFKDSRFSLPLDEIVYIQKFQISPVMLKLDYKPKRVDYVGIRSGNSAEFMNFFILDGSTINLAEATVYGLLGMPSLGKALGEVWGPQIQQTQIAGILAGLAPIRSIVNIGGGVKDLIAIPISEYKKDGRLFRSIQKGTQKFAKTTGYEILNLGVKLASGTQVILEQGEQLLGGEGSGARLPASRGSNSQKCNVNKRSSYKVAAKVDFNKLLANSQVLNQSVRVDRDQYANKKFYSYIDIDEDDDELVTGIDKELLSKSIFLLPRDDNSKKEGEEDEADDSSADEEGEKLISLYSNQPENIQEGMKLAYKSFGNNLKITKRQLINLKNELNESENIQDSLKSILKSSPIIFIRPIIGSTEALSKALMGLGNEIDSKRIVESRDKYRYIKRAKDEDVL